jgi:hypothetical protein
MPKTPKPLNAILRLLSPHTPKDPETGRILSRWTGKTVGSSQPSIYEYQNDPDIVRFYELEEKLNELRGQNRLWNTEEEDPEVAATIKEYETLKAKAHPTLSDPLSFHNEDWDDEETTNGS